MSKKSGKLNNQGSTLLTVIICLAFIGILGSMMLSVTMTNLQMKIVESKSKKNFYTCEMAMEEIRTGLQEQTANAIKTVYEEDVLPDYAYYLSQTEEERNITIQDLVVNELVGEIGAVSDTMFDRYLSESSNTKVTVDSIENYLASDGKTASVLIRNTSVEYTKDDYQTSITSDIRITIPKFSFNQGNENADSDLVQPFKNYVLVADGGIISDNAAGTNIITGNIYAGNSGITINNYLRSGGHQVVINADDIVTRGNIMVSDTGKLTVGTTKAPDIWAKNLVTQTSFTYNQSGSMLPTMMNINGNSIIQDDLVLDGQNSMANFTGSYIGYTGTHNSKGSAMMINGAGSSLRLDGLTELILAGRAHVTVEDNALNKDTEILTGESIAFKGNQLAYLIPGKFIGNILHNPVTEADIADFGVPDITITPDSKELDYNRYVADSPYKIAAKQSVTEGGLATILRYYYFNFESGKAADEYLEAFFEKYPSYNSGSDPIPLGNVTLPGHASHIYSAGNMFSYPEVTDDSKKSVVLTPGLSSGYPDDSSLDNYISRITLDPGLDGSELGGKAVSQLGGLYSRISRLLTLEGTPGAYQEADPVVASILTAGGIGYLYDNADSLSSPDFDYIRYRGSSYTINTASSSSQSFAVIDGNVTIEKDGIFNGILAASGDITIGAGTVINGMLLTTGENGEGNITVGDGVTVNGRLAAVKDIRLGTDCSFTINEDIENNFIAPLFLKEGTILSNLFKNAQATVDLNSTEPASNLVDLSISNIITYENWRKN